MICSHLNFRSDVEVTRVERRPMATVRIRCAECGRAFCFMGLRTGMYLDGPATSMDRVELRAPIEPSFKQA